MNKEKLKLTNLFRFCTLLLRIKEKNFTIKRKHPKHFQGANDARAKKKLKTTKNTVKVIGALIFLFIFFC